MLTDRVIGEFLKEPQIKPVPAVSASVLGGPKGCTYKAPQLIDRRCEGKLSLLVRDLCSEDDQLATYSVQNFSQRLLKLGGDANLIKWYNSPHVGILFTPSSLPKSHCNYEVC